MFDPKTIQQDFPILQKKLRQAQGRRLVYLDNAATSQKPIQVIDAISNYYKNSNANVHRGVHQLSDESTSLWESSRQVVAEFFGADNEELIITRNTTEAINGIAYGWGLDNLHKDDVILCTEMEHHSNLVVWQEVCKRTGAKLEFIPVLEDGRLDTQVLGSRCQVLGDRLKLLALTHVSNALGTLNPIEKILDIVHKSQSLRQAQENNTNNKPLILLDGAQSAPHLPINFHKLNIDFFVFSGHKMLGPMGIGGVLIKKSLLQSMKVKPWLFGGGMIQAVHSDHTEFAEELSDRFTAGTPDVASMVGLAEACKYLDKLGMRNVQDHDRKLVEYTIAKLSEIPEVRIVGAVSDSRFQIPDGSLEQNVRGEATNHQSRITNHKYLDRVGSVAFLYEGVHPHDVAQILDSEGIAVRSGHHCTMPLHTKFDWPGTVRVSFQVYNSTDDIDLLIEALRKVKKVFNSK